jgi:hypothetical protein
MTFKDQFSGRAQQYSQFRPRYPEVLFSYFAELAPVRLKLLLLLLILLLIHLPFLD